MPTRFEGSLLVKKIHGRNGAFCIGELITDIGEFKVKDPLIDQFEDGTYQGSFWVSQVYPFTYCAFGKVIVEIRAKLADLQIDGESDLPADAGKLQEPDPAEEQSVAKPAQVLPDASKPTVNQGNRENKAKQAPSTSSAGSRSTKQDGKQDEDDLALFGDELYELIRNGKPLKLDSTIDRLQLRRQIHRLGVIGYAFTAMTQSWSKPDANSTSG